MMHQLVSLSFLALLGTSLVQASPWGGGKEFHFPFHPHDGTTAVEAQSKAGHLDWPKLSPGPNATTYDWWYFDAVSETNETIVIVAYLYGNDTLGLPTFGGGTTIAYVGGTFANGTAFQAFVPSNGGATVKTSREGVVGEWKGAGLKFKGSPLDRPDTTYTVTVDFADAGISGTLTLQSVSPPHYPCGLNVPGQSQEIIPKVFWANAQPDAIATVAFTIGDESVAFKGVGYHDKNWGIDSLRTTVRTWYWGHGRLGPYLIVRFDTLDQDGKEYYSSWITRNGKVISQSCKDKSIVVRPWGGNTEYPPEPNGAPPAGFTLRYDLGNGRFFSANFTREIDGQTIDIYRRFSGSLTGGLEGGEQFEGRALGEQFQHPAL